MSGEDSKREKIHPIFMVIASLAIFVLLYWLFRR
jgi:preprotein translocase subunit SecE